jgi:hypothetical protein
MADWDIVVLVIIITFVIGVIFYDKSKTVEGLNTFNGKMAVNGQYFHDKLFDDVYYYPNEYEKNYEKSYEEDGKEIGKLVKTGWIRCKEECPGHCMEYGISGHTYCYSY